MVMTGQRPVPPVPTLNRMQAILLEDTLVSLTVMAQLNMCGFRVRSFIANVDFHDDATVTLHERLEVLIVSVIRISSRGVTATDALFRVAILEERLRE